MIIMEDDECSFHSRESGSNEDELAAMRHDSLSDYTWMGHSSSSSSGPKMPVNNEDEDEEEGFGFLSLDNEEIDDLLPKEPHEHRQDHKTYPSSCSLLGDLMAPFIGDMAQQPSIELDESRCYTKNFSHHDEIPPYSNSTATSGGAPYFESSFFLPNRLLTTSRRSNSDIASPVFSRTPFDSLTSSDESVSTATPPRSYYCDAVPAATAGTTRADLDRNSRHMVSPSLPPAYYFSPIPSQYRIANGSYTNYDRSFPIDYSCSRPNSVQGARKILPFARGEGGGGANPCPPNHTPTLFPFLAFGQSGVVVPPGRRADSHKEHPVTPDMCSPSDQTSQEAATCAFAERCTVPSFSNALPVPSYPLLQDYRTGTAKRSLAAAFDEEDASPSSSPRRTTEVSNKRTANKKSGHMPPSFFQYQCHLWMDHYKEAKCFAIKHGHCMIRSGDSNRSLTHWAKRQRYQYKLLQESTQQQYVASTASTDGDPEECGSRVITSFLSKERIRMLNDIGFVWDIRSDTWWKRYEELIDFKRQYGHTTVPIKYKPNMKLANWVKYQRRHYAIRSSCLTPKRIHLLQQVGFLWVVAGKSKRLSKNDNREDYHHHCHHTW